LEFFNDININLEELIKNYTAYFGFDSPFAVIRAIIEIGLVSYGVYKLIVLVKETRAWQLIKGIVFILLAAWVSRLLGLKTIWYILDKTIYIIGFALVVIFQPELRRGLERLGRSRFRDLFMIDEESKRLQSIAVIEEIVKACTEMANDFVGALIVIEREIKVGEVINTGVQLDSVVSSELLINIFTPGAPLHDGAVIIRDNKIKAAACFLPLTDNPNLSKELGARHRAALGITEVSDCICVIVSEESGKISYGMNGGLTRNLTPDTLRKALSKNLLGEKDQGRKPAFWKVRSR
jgi:diadenylate cyclase